MRGVPVLVACMVAAAAMLSLPGHAQDMAKTGKNVKVLLDNDEGPRHGT